MKRRFWERTDKGGSSTPGSFDSRGRVSSHFFLYFVVVVVVTFLLSSREEEEEEVDDDTGSLSLAQKREFFLFFFFLECAFLEDSGKIDEDRDHESWRVDNTFPDKQKPTLLETLGLCELMIKVVKDAPAIRFGFRRGCWSSN